MALDPRALLAQATGLPWPLKVLAGVCVFDLLIILVANFSVAGQVEEGANRVAQLHEQLDQLRTRVRSAHADIDKLPELRKQYDEAIAAGVLQAPDRLKLVQTSQEAGNRHHVPDMHYRLDPEQQKVIASSKYSLVISPVSLETGGLLDPEILDFWEEIFGGLTGRYEITEVTMERTGQVTPQVLDSIRAGRPVSLIRTNLKFRWVSLRPPQATAQQ